jgi:hypothetical protein
VLHKSLGGFHRVVGVSIGGQRGICKQLSEVSGNALFYGFIALLRTRYAWLSKMQRTVTAWRGVLAVALPHIRG